MSVTKLQEKANHFKINPWTKRDSAVIIYYILISVGK